MKNIEKIILNNHYVWIGLVTILSMVLTGYHVGGFDQSIHIPFLKQAIDPSLYPNDTFFELRHEHFSYFWYLFFPFYRAGIFYEALFIAQLLATYATFFMIWKISYRLFESHLTARLATLFLMLPHIAFSGFPVIEFQTLNRTIVLPFVLYALDLVLQKKMVRAFFLLGVMYNFHVVTVNFLLIPAGLLLLKDALNDKHVVQIPKALFFFLLGALPVISWKLGSSGIPLQVHPEWFWTIDQGVLNNVFSFLTSTDYVILANLGGGAIMLMMFYLYRNASWNTLQLRMWFIGWVSLITVLLTFVLYEVYPFTLLVQFQLTRAMVLTQIVFFMFLAADTAKRWTKMKSKERILETLIVIFSLTPLFLLAQKALTLLIRSSAVRLVSLSVLTMTIFMSMILVYGELWKPGIFMKPQRTAWVDIQLWAHEQTEINDIFLTPPEIWWHTTPSWHVYSERSNVASLSDLLEIAFFPKYYDTWKSRFEMVAPGAHAEFTGNFLTNQRIVRDAYYGLTEQDILDIQTKYNTSYFIAENSYEYEFPIAYRNDEYTAYILP